MSLVLLILFVLDFNPDALEAKDAKEEYDSDPSDTGSETDEGEGSGSGSEGEKSKRRKVRTSVLHLVYKFQMYLFRKRLTRKQLKQNERSLLLPLKEDLNPRRKLSFLASLRSPCQVTSCG